MEICEILHIFLANPKDFLIFVFFFFFFLNKPVYLYIQIFPYFRGLMGGLRKLL